MLKEHETTLKQHRNRIKTASKPGLFEHTAFYAEIGASLN